VTKPYQIKPISVDLKLEFLPTTIAQSVNIAGRQTTPLIFVETNLLALYVATTVIKWDTLLETVAMSPFVLSASKVVTLEIIVNNILLKRHDAIMGVMPRKY
jgi:hypothetical protein